MKRLDRDLKNPKNIPWNLIRKIAWSYSTSTKIPFDDLFQESLVAYLEKIDLWDPKKAKKSTYVWYIVHSRLNTYVKTERQFKAPLTDLNLLNNISYESSSLFENFSNLATEITKLICDNSDLFIDYSKFKIKSEVTKKMKIKGVHQEQVCKSFNEIEYYLYNN